MVFEKKMEKFTDSAYFIKLISQLERKKAEVENTESLKQWRFRIGTFIELAFLTTEKSFELDNSVPKQILEELKDAKCMISHLSNGYEVILPKIETKSEKYHISVPLQIRKGDYVCTFLDNTFQKVTYIYGTFGGSHSDQRFIIEFEDPKYNMTVGKEQDLKVKN